MRAITYTQLPRKTDDTTGVRCEGLKELQIGRNILGENLDKPLRPIGVKARLEYLKWRHCSWS